MAAPNAKELGELLDEASVKVPALISGLIETLYSAEAGKNMGQAVGNLYRELIDAGLPQEEALKMARDYMFTITTVTQNFSGKPENIGNKAQRFSSKPDQAGNTENV